MITFIKPHPTDKVEYTILQTPLRFGAEMHFNISKEDKAYIYLKDLFKLLCNDKVVVNTVDYFALLNHMNNKVVYGLRLTNRTCSSYSGCLEMIQSIINEVESGSLLFINFTNKLRFCYTILTQEQAPHIRTLVLNKFMLRNGL